MKGFILLLLMLFSTVSGTAQFRLLGTAREMESGCIMLTPDYPYTGGIAYNEEKLNLAEFFEIQFDIFLGENDSLGADGIVFVIHDDSRGFNAFGTYGEGLGYGKFNPRLPGGTYISPSIALEFDTYQNGQQNDPECDHVAFLKNGLMFHQNYWNGGNKNLNLEDGVLHSFRFRWNPNSNTVTAFLDEYMVYQAQIDLINNIFNGNTEVIWGFTASTGRKTNLQYFCLKKLAIIKDKSKLAISE